MSIVAFAFKCCVEVDVQCCRIVIQPLYNPTINALCLRLDGRHVSPSNPVEYFHPFKCKRWWVGERVGRSMYNVNNTRTMCIRVPHVTLSCIYLGRRGTRVSLVVVVSF